MEADHDETSPLFQAIKGGLQTGFEVRKLLIDVNP